MSVSAILVAGGGGTRMQAQLNKVFLQVSGRSILERTLQLFQSSPEVQDIVLVVRAADLHRCEGLSAQFEKLRTVVPGGDIRHRSEFAGLRALASRIDAGEIDIVLVHDAVRPFASPTLIRRVVAGLTSSIGCIPGLPIDPHIILVQDGWISGYPHNLWAIQTPQAFHATWLLEAHNKAARQGFVGTDTASVVEWAGGDVRVIEGEVDNIKITIPTDLVIGEQIATNRSNG